MKDVAEIDAVLEKLYDAVLEPVRLPGALESIDRWLGSDLCHLVGMDREDKSVNLSIMTNTTLSETDTAPFQRMYADYYHEIDPRRRMARERGVGDIFTCSDYFDERYSNRSEFYQDFLIPFGARYVAGGCLLRNETQEIYVAFNHMLGRDPFTQDELSRIRYISSHLQRVVHLLTRVESLRAGFYAGEHGLDALDQGVIVLNRSGAISFTNAYARLLLNEETALQIRGNKLEAIVNSKALDAALSRVHISRYAESLTLTTMERSGAGLRKYYLTILGVPLDGHDAASVSHHLGSPNNANVSFGAFSNADLIVLISSPQRSTVVSAKQLMQLFQLSAAEARLAHALAKGMSLEEYADEACVSMPTVRTHLRSVLKKTGERRQQDLVRVLATLPSVSQ